MATTFPVVRAVLATRMGLAGPAPRETPAAVVVAAAVPEERRMSPGTASISPPRAVPVAVVVAAVVAALLARLG